MTKKEMQEELKRLALEAGEIEVSSSNGSFREFRTEDGEAWSDIPELNGDEIVEEIDG